MVYDAGTIYLATDKGERRRTGSYYTPEHIVDQIVQKTLGVQCGRISEQLQREIGSCEDEIRDAEK